MRIIENNRIVNRNMYISKEVFDKVQKVKSGKIKVIKTRDRRSTIMTEFVGLQFEIYNGKSYLPLFIQESMIGHKLGEFIPTRTFKKHGGDKKKIGGKK